MSHRVLVTCALPYVNNVPHLGNMVPILSADVYARYLRLTGQEVIYICATDEHGTRTEMEAERAELSPAEWCERLHAQILESYLWFNVRFDHFGRTSSPANHQLTSDIAARLDANGYLFDEEVEQLYCESCRRFLPDTYVSGCCPVCNTPEASGNQCDTCGHLLDPWSLLEPACKICGHRPASRRSRHLFLDLPRLAPALRSWIEAQGHWEGIVRSVPLGWIDKGLKPRCITRDLSWGVKVPREGFEDKVFYVWFDAPVGYVAATAEWAEAAGRDWRDWWKDPEARIVHFLGKDNVPFHTIMWPASLMGADDGWNLPHTIAANEYLNYEAGQFSKSRGRGIFSSDVRELPFAPDVWRFYLMAHRPERKDVDFSWVAFQHTANADLVGNLGNLAHRVTTFLRKRFGRVPPATTDPGNLATLAEARTLVERIASNYEAMSLRAAAQLLLELGDHGNLYFQRNEPWHLLETDRERCGQVMHTAARILSQLAWAMAPLMPKAAGQIRDQLGVEAANDVWEVDPALADREVAKPRPLFARVEEDTVAELQLRFGGTRETPPELHYAIDPAIDYFSFLVELSGLTVKKRSAELERRKRQTLAELDLEALRQHPSLAAYALLLAQRDRGGRSDSVSNLIRIVEKSGKLPAINTVVDAYNLQSLKHAIVMGAYDRRVLAGHLRMKIADGHEHFVPVTGQEPEAIQPGEWIIVDEEDRVATKVVTKQSQAVAVTVQTTDAALCVQGYPALDRAQLLRITQETCELIQRLCGGRWRIVNP